MTAEGPRPHIEIVTGTQAGLLTRAAERLGGRVKPPYAVEVVTWPGENVAEQGGNERKLLGTELQIAITGGPNGDITQLREEAREIGRQRRSEASRKGSWGRNARRINCSAF